MIDQSFQKNPHLHWTLNIRGNDIEFFQLVLAYAIISKNTVELYIDESKLDAGMKVNLAKDSVVLYPYNDVYEDARKIGENEVVLLDPSKVNYALYNNIPANVLKVEQRNPEILFKAIKNPVEIENIRKSTN